MWGAVVKGRILLAVLLFFNAGISYAQAVRLQITGSSAVTAGGTIKLKITAVDLLGRRARTYDGDKHLVFSGANPSADPQRAPAVTDKDGDAVAFGQSTTVEFDKGVAESKNGENGLLQLFRAEEAVISVTDGVIGSSGDDRLTVRVSPASLDRFSFSLDSPQRSGVPFEGTNRLRALDEYGNTVTDFDASANHVTVTSTISGTITGLGSGGNVLDRGSDFASGVADLTGELTFTGSGTGTFTARSQTGKTGTSGSVEVTAPPAPVTAARLRIQTQPSSTATAGVPFSRQPVVRVEDANGNLMSSDNSTVVSAARASGSGTLQGRVSVTAVGGIAAFTDLSHNVAGDITIAFSSSPSLTTETSNSIRVSAAAASRLVFVQEPSDAKAGETIQPPVTVRGQDAYGNTAAPGSPMLLTLSSGSGTLSGTTQRNADASGLATFDDLRISEAGTKQLRAQSGSLSPAFSRSFAISAAAAPTIVASGGTPQSAVVGTAFGTNLQCTVRDGNGNPMVGVTVTFAAPASGASGTFAGNSNTAVTGQSGIAVAAVFTANMIAGSYTVTASAAGVAGSASFALTNVAAPSTTTRLRIVSGNGQSAQAGEQFPARFSAEVRGQNDIPVPNVTVVFSAPSSGPSGTFNGRPSDSTTTNSAGVAQSSLFTANSIVGSYTVQVATAGASPGVIALTNVAGPLQSFSVTDTAGNLIGAQAAGVPFPIRITARDRFNNVARSFTGTVDVASSGALSAGAGQTAPFVDGILASHRVSFAATGTFAISVQQTGGTAAGSSNSFVVENPVPTIASIMPGSGARGSTVTVTVTGTGYVAGITSVTFGDQIATSTTVVDSAHLGVTLTIDANAQIGTRDVSVVNLPPGGGTSTLQNGFSVTAAPSAVITAVTPSVGARLDTMNVEISGTHLPTSGGTVDFGPGITVNALTSYGSSRLVANIGIQPGAATGPRSVRVVSATGDTTVALNAFTVQNPLPILISVIPASVPVGRDTTLVARGAKFINGVTTLLLGTGITVRSLTVESSSELRARISVSSSATVGERPINAVNSGPGGGSSATIPLSVTMSAYPSSISIAGAVPFPMHDQPEEYSSADYRLVGLPGASNAGLAAYVPGSPGNDWQAYWDDGSPSGEYLHAYDGSAVFTFGVGRAFWLIKKGTWTFSGTVPAALPDSNAFVTVPLHAGWNLITNPTPSSVSWSQIQQLNDYVSEPIFGFSGGFSIAQSLEPYAGYYFFNGTQRSGLKIPVMSATNGKSADMSASVARLESGPDWRVTIRLTSGPFEDSTTVFGVSPLASAGYDPNDYRKPSRAPGELPGISFQRPEWDPAFASFGGDIRPAVADTGYTTWALQLAGTPGTPCVLEFDGVQDIPARYGVVLLDEQHARGQDLRKDRTYALTPRHAVTTLRVLVGAPAAVQQALANAGPTTFALGNNYPNPFNPSTTIPVDLPAVAEIELAVYNTLGQEVALLFRGGLGAGRHYFTWNGRDGTGSSVASGMYVCRVSGNGFSAVRKMMLVK